MHLLLCLSLVTAAADEAKIYSVAQDKSVIKYKLIHKMHTVVGTAKKDIDGKVKMQGGNVQTMVRVAVAAFDSENSNRDANMKETVEAAKYPFVELKAVAENVVPGQTTSALLKGRLTFHGVTNPIEVPVTLAWQGASGARVSGKFGISLEAYKIERPSLLLVKVDDKLELEIELQIKE